MGLSQLSEINDKTRGDSRVEQFRSDASLFLLTRSKTPLAGSFQNMNHAAYGGIDLPDRPEFRREVPQG